MPSSSTCAPMRSARPGGFPTTPPTSPSTSSGERAGELGKDRTIVFYCRSGDRSAVAADAFTAAGYDAVSLAGGIVAWQEAGRPVEGEVGHPSGLPPR